MEHYAGIDVSLEQSSVCVVDATGWVVREAKVASEPEALARWFAKLGLPLARIGLEAGPLSQWLYAGLREAGLAVELHHRAGGMERAGAVTATSRGRQGESAVATTSGVSAWRPWDQRGCEILDRFYRLGRRIGDEKDF